MKQSKPKASDNFRSANDDSIIGSCFRSPPRLQLDSAQDPPPLDASSLPSELDSQGECVPSGSSTLTTSILRTRSLTLAHERARTAIPANIDCITRAHD
uniref:Uncharacterized protein n=1 Tax=Steinernema glaseri TaxID=37863 RepID=A0A1I7ZB63_9BILA